MRQVTVKVPHFTERVAEAQWLVGHPEMTPELLGPNRDLLRDTLQRFTDAVVDRRVDEQLLHGEPHLGNLLRTGKGLLFVDLETPCRGPVEFDVDRPRVGRQARI
jgi:5-methylthioribose kinase